MLDHDVQHTQPVIIASRKTLRELQKSQRGEAASGVTTQLLLQDKHRIRTRTAYDAHTKAMGALRETATKMYPLLLQLPFVIEVLGEIR